MLWVAIVGSGTSVWAWGSVAVLGRVFPFPGDWMTVLCLDACLIVGGGGWLVLYQNPGPCSMY